LGKWGSGRAPLKCQDPYHLLPSTPCIPAAFPYGKGMKPDSKKEWKDSIISIYPAVFSVIIIVERMIDLAYNDWMFYTWYAWKESV
jgi:hypothetical protein